MVYSTSDLYIIRIIENRVMDMKGAAAQTSGAKPLPSLPSCRNICLSHKISLGISWNSKEQCLCIIPQIITTGYPQFQSDSYNRWGYIAIWNNTGYHYSMCSFFCMFTCLHMVKRQISASWIGETHPIRTSI